jgi:hypothetical protein
MNAENKYKVLVHELLLKTLMEDVIHCTWSENDFWSIPPTKEDVDQRAEYFGHDRAAYLQQELDFWVDEELVDGLDNPAPQTPLQSSKRLLHQLKAMDVARLNWFALYFIGCQLYPQARKLFVRNLVDRIDASADDREFLEYIYSRNIPFFQEPQ